VAISRLRTDPWTHRAGQPAEASGEGRVPR
jgi:hypothetical protein